MSTPNTLPQELEEKLGEIEKERIEQQAKDIADKNNLAYINIATNPIDLEVLGLIKEEESRTAQAAATSKEGKKIKVAVVDPKNPETQKLIARLTQEGFSLNLGVVSVLGMQKIWNKYKEISKQTEEKIGTVSIDESVVSEIQKEIKNIADLKEKISGISTTNILEILIGGAIKVEASDIHLEPEEKNIRLRYRIDGVLNDVTEIKSESYKNKNKLRIKAEHTQRASRWQIYRKL
ncbi:MAG: hypothetical protein HYT63_01955 [Candidatus Yanofskybacteria bacterium]|nr:hypothetical protein [Candidatus Yanofskybacteria bacterium]